MHKTFMDRITCLLVGAHFRPPAKQLLSILPAGQQLLLIPEPDNAHDSEAIKVMLDLSTLPFPYGPSLDEVLEGTGFDSANLIPLAAVGELLQLGYIATAKNKAMKDRPDLTSNSGVLQALSHALQGVPLDEDDPPDTSKDKPSPPWPAKLGFEVNYQPTVVIELTSET